MISTEKHNNEVNRKKWTRTQAYQGVKITSWSCAREQKHQFAQNPWEGLPTIHLVPVVFLSDDGLNTTSTNFCTTKIAVLSNVTAWQLNPILQFFLLLLDCRYTHCRYNIQADEWSCAWQITHFAKCQKTQHNMLLQVSTPTMLSATKWSKKCNNLVPPTSTTINPCSQPSHVKTILKIDVSRIHKIILLGTQMDNRYISMSRACCL